MNKSADSFFRDRDGNRDAAALIMVMVGVAGFLSIGTFCLLAAWSIYLDPAHAFNPQPLGSAISSVLMGLGAFLAAFAAYQVTDGVNRKSQATAMQMDRTT